MKTRCWKCNIEVSNNPWHTLDCQAVMREVPEYYKTQPSIVQHNAAKFALEQRGKFNGLLRYDRSYRMVEIEE